MTQSLLTVLTPASNRALTTLAAVKDEIDTTGGDSDARLLRWIASKGTQPRKLKSGARSPRARKRRG
jgi:hypothetical protein